MMTFIIRGKHAETELQRRGIEPDQINPDDNEAVQAVRNYILESFWKKSLEGRDVKHPDIILEGTWDWLKWVGTRKPIDVFIDRFEGKLESTWKKTIKRDVIDESRKEKHTAEKEITESQLDAQRKAQGKETDIPFLETIPSPEPVDKEPIDLKSLVLNIDELTPTELQAVERVFQALGQGCSLDSKTGNSLSQYLGDDYQKTMRAFSRAKAKLKKH